MRHILSEMDRKLAVIIGPCIFAIFLIASYAIMYAIFSNPLVFVPIRLFGILFTITLLFPFPFFQIIAFRQLVERIDEILKEEESE